jgi:hypothetical protein
MSQQAKEFLWIVQESALNTPVALPVTWPTTSANAFYIRLSDGNSFSMIAKPIHQKIPYGGGYAVTSEVVSDHYTCEGTLKTQLYGSHAAMLLGWALTRNDGTNPWTTSEPVGDLASCSVYHAVRRSDGTYERKVYSGCKVTSCDISVSRSSTTAMLTLGLKACKSAGNQMDGTTDPTSDAFPAPTEVEYPLGPYTFKMTSGGLTVASVRTGYEDLSIKVQNALDGRWFETSFLQVNQFCGRNSTFDATLYLKATPNDRTAFEAITAQSCALAFTNGVMGQNLTIQFNGQNRITDLPYDLPLNRAFMQKLSLVNLFDQTAGQDISISFA